VLDDDGHRMERGKRYAMCAKTFALFSHPPYQDQFILVEPAEPISSCAASPWDYARAALRHPSETKGGMARLATTATSENCCAPASEC